MKRGISQFVGALLIAALAAGCGGGADQSPNHQISVSKPNVAPITGTRVVGDYLPTVLLSGTVSGNLEALNGISLHVALESPVKLFVPSSLIIERTATGATYKLALYGDVLRTPGHFTGNLIIRACLDDACTLPIDGTPISIPYDVTVQAGLTLARKEVTVSAPFGTTPSREAIAVAYSSGSNGWYAGLSTPYDPYAGPSTIETVPTPNNFHSTGPLLIDFFPATPGEHVETLKVYTYAIYSDTTQGEFNETVTVRYTVTPNPAVDAVFHPAATNFVQKRQTTILYYPYRVVANTGVAAQWMGIEYLTSAGTTGPVSSWWDESPYQSAHTCVGELTEVNCLAPGLYTARVKYRLTTPTGTRDVYYPINMTVTN
ncbi:MAG: hypothetical protein V4484_02235 [Pseudomonadota bacterium]